jgi:hypothetical protein
MAGQHLIDRPQDSLVKVRIAIRELRMAYRDGRSILRKLGPRADLGEHQIEQAADEHHRTADACRKLRQFAMLYNGRDMKELCGLCLRYRRALGLSLLYKLVSIESRKDRREFQRKAIAEHWGHTRITRELRIRFGRRDELLGRKQRGRKPHISQNITEVLVQIEDMARYLFRWQEHFAEMAEQGQVEQLPPAVSRNLHAAIEAALILYESASRACKRSQEG